MLFITEEEPHASVCSPPLQRLYLAAPSMLELTVKLANSALLSHSALTSGPTRGLMDRQAMAESWPPAMLLGEKAAGNKTETVLTQSHF